MSLFSIPQFTVRNTVSIVSLLLLTSLPATVMSAEQNESRRSTSISFTETDIPDKLTKDSRLKSEDADIMPALETQGSRIESTLKALHISASTVYHNEVSIYDTSTELISDFDDDGFYHRFSVAIDADTFSASAFVYARLYLSYEGGPWNHYATSDNYHLFSDSGQDIFIIETELADGFPAGYYDIRIELYDADYGDWLTSYGPYDDASLSALPLEDSYYDDQYAASLYPVETDVVIAGHSGSMSAWLLFLPALIGFIRGLGVTGMYQA